MEKVFIYTLSHPITKEIRYVGKTKNLKERFHNHCNKLHNENTHKRNWIESLRRQNLKPLMSVIDEVPILEWKYWEKFWIKYLKCFGCDLVNHTSGGEGLTLGNQTSFKKGHKSWLGKNHTEESKKKISKNSYTRGKPAFNRKKVIQMDKNEIIIKIWGSIFEAAKFTNSNSSKIVACCKEKRKSHNNFKWKYA